MHQAQNQGLWIVDQGLNLPLILSQQGLGYRSIIRGLRVFGHVFRRSLYGTVRVSLETSPAVQSAAFVTRCRQDGSKTPAVLSLSQSSTFRVSPCRERSDPGSGD